MADAPSIVQALGAVMADVQAVRKGERNQQQNFSFRGIDAVVNAVGPALRKHGVVCVPHLEHIDYRDVAVGQKQTPMRECQVTITYRFHGPAGDHLDARVSAEALDSGDKATAKAHSVAYRTCLLQALTIPTDEPDPDSETHERAPQNAGQSWQKQAADRLYALGLSASEQRVAVQTYDAAADRPEDLDDKTAERVTRHLGHDATAQRLVSMVRQQPADGDGQKQEEPF